MHFGATLRLLRIDAGLSLRALAERIGVSSTYLSRVENGLDSTPTPDRLAAIARSFGLPPTLLVELAHQTGAFVSSYLETVPSANVLFLEIARRRCTGPQLARIKAFLQEEFGPVRSAAGNLPQLSDLIGEDRVILRLSCVDMEDLIDVAAARLAHAIQRPDASTLAARIWERERVASTAIGSGVAAPHALFPKIQPVAALITLARPLDVETPDGNPLRMAVVCVAPERTRGPLELLAQVARLASHNCAEAFCALRSPAEALAKLRLIESASA